MSALFEEIDYRPTPIGPISLRRRRVMSLDTDVYEIMLGDEHLMSSLFTASEIALARLGLSEVDGDALDVVVGGLGLGYTAGEVLRDNSVASLLVVEYLEAVIDWHAQELVPLTPPLKSDDRCRIVQGDFFALAASVDGFDATTPRRLFHAILIDIDHAPNMLLDERSEGFYAEHGLASLAAHLHPKGVMGLWSNSLPDNDFTDRLATVFGWARAEPVTFTNPLQNNRQFTQTVYLARKEPV